MSREEKVQSVRELEDLGEFKIKGAVDQIGLLMGVSRFTVYNYLQKIHAEQDVNKY